MNSNNSNRVIPLNYSVKAISNMDYVANNFQNTGNINMSSITKSIKDLLSLSEHFLMPDNGRYSENAELIQENMDIFKLPYPVIAAEFTMNATDEIDDLHVVAVKKRIALAFEINTDDSIGDEIFRSHGEIGFSWIKDKGVIVWPVDWHSSIKMWVPSYCGAFIEYDQTLSNPDLLSKAAWGNLGWDTSKIGCRITPIIPSDPITRSSNISKSTVLVDTNAEIVSIFQLCTMLNCKNITVEKIQQSKLNKTRMKRGKLPNFEYHVLKVKHSPKKNNCSVPAYRNRPRTHMRRGHIRRINSGAVWVNHSVINPGHGYIEKDYLV